MPRIVPSQVVDLIDRLFPWAKEQRVGDVHSHPLNRENSGQLAAIVTMVEQVPAEFLTIEGEGYAELLGSLAAIKDRFTTWQSRDYTLHHISGFPTLSPVTLIRRALVQGHSISKIRSSFLITEETSSWNLRF
jgi:hypothetical protein